MTPEQIGFLIGAIIGGLMAGAFCGLLPLGIGRWKNRVSLGVAALITCTICGAILGLLLAAPVAIIFALVIVVMGSPPAQPADYESQTRI